MAIAVASAVGYALLAIVGRSLPPADFALFVAFWGVLFGLGSSLSIVEQETARATADEGRQDTGPPAHAVTAAAALLAMLLAATTLVPALAERLYGDADSRMGLLVTAAALGFAVQFAVRGRLMGSGAVQSYGWLVMSEALARLGALAVVLVIAGIDLWSAGVAVAIGSFAWLGWARRARSVLPRRGPSLIVWAAAARRAATLMLAAGLSATVITGYPTMVAALTAEQPGAAGGAVFAALTVSRVPLLLVSPLQALTVPYVVRAQAQAQTSTTPPLQRGLLVGTAAAVAVGLLGGAAGYLAGPWVVRRVYGAAYEVSGQAVGLLVLSAFLLAWVLLLSAALVALASHRGMILMWSAGAGSTAVWLLASPLPLVETTAVGALVGPCAAAAVALPLLWRLVRPAQPRTG
ncbi:hypothetical protein J4G33_03885 [Actinotalea sp. BY-33]|uniref:Polysaccharide biosynthesis protein n=1 Tax=Actinotalea soli TaxID=2819234 RepID=A0A939RSE5_9CELL|nr:hypothetical protein [Actinotalea soli]MBO1750937.1 hypothetical protein [Actinotalea soli]